MTIEARELCRTSDDDVSEALASLRNFGIGNAEGQIEGTVRAASVCTDVGRGSGRQGAGI